MLNVSGAGRDVGDEAFGPRSFAEPLAGRLGKGRFFPRLGNVDGGVGRTGSAEKFGRVVCLLGSGGERSSCSTNDSQVVSSELTLPRARTDGPARPVGSSVEARFLAITSAAKAFCCCSCRADSASTSSSQAKMSYAASRASISRLVSSVAQNGIVRDAGGAVGAFSASSTADLFPQQVRRRATTAASYVRDRWRLFNRWQESRNRRNWQRRRLSLYIELFEEVGGAPAELLQPVKTDHGAAFAGRELVLLDEQRGVTERVERALARVGGAAGGAVHVRHGVLPAVLRVRLGEQGTRINGRRP